MNVQPAEVSGVLNEMPALLWVTGADGACQFVNRRWTEFTGQDLAEALGGKWLDSVHEEDRGLFSGILHPTGQPCDPFVFECRMRKADGGFFRVRHSVAPRLDSDGKCAGFVGVVTGRLDPPAPEALTAVSEERYRGLLQSIDEGFCVIQLIFDPADRPIDYRWLETNSSFEQQTGLGQVVGKRVREVVPNLDESWFQIYGKVALTGESIRFENHASALNRWFNVFAFRVGAVEDRQVALLFDDITERKIREKNAVFFAEIGEIFARVSGYDEIMAMVGEKLCQHLDSTSAAFGEIDETGNYGTVFHERRVEGIPSLSGVHYLPDFMSEEFLRDLRAGKTIAVSDVATDPRTAALSEAYRQFRVFAQIQAPHVSDGRWKFMLGVYCDHPREWHPSEVDLARELSARVWLRLERARVEEELRESERQARAFFEGSGVGAAQVAPDKRFMRVNDRFCEITGFSRKELVTMTPFDLDHPEERAADAVRIQKMVSDPDFIYDVEKRYVRKDGRIIWVHVNSRTIRGADGEILYAASVIYDVTARKTAESALRESENNLRELSRSLEQRVADRTVELEDLATRLRRMAVALATAEQRERKRLAALLHDDLQQLLVAATMHLNKTTRRMQNPFERQAVEQAARWIAEATTAARTLTHQLRPPALYEGGLVDALVGVAQEMEKRHGISVNIETTDLVVKASDDINAILFEAVRELLFNAAKHSQAKRAAVRLREEGGWLHVLVEDRGKGFDPAQTVSNRTEGGFGLFSIRERLVALGGQFSVVSSPGDGTRIELRIPLGVVAGQEGGLADGESHEEESLASPAQTADGAGRIRILVVDDHAMVRQGLATLVSEDDRLAVVGEAADGLGAIEAAERFRPDAMLIDVNMPRMNGIEATREIHRRWPMIRIIGLSVQDDETTAAAMRNAGASAFLSKGGDSCRLIQTIVDLAGGD